MESSLRFLRNSCSTWNKTAADRLVVLLIGFGVAFPSISLAFSTHRLFAASLADAGVSPLSLNALACHRVPPWGWPDRLGLRSFGISHICPASRRLASSSAARSSGLRDSSIAIPIATPKSSRLRIILLRLIASCSAVARWENPQKLRLFIAHAWHWHTASNSTSR